MSPRSLERLSFNLLFHAKHSKGRPNQRHRPNQVKSMASQTAKVEFQRPIIKVRLVPISPQGQLPVPASRYFHRKRRGPWTIGGYRVIAS